MWATVRRYEGVTDPEEAGRRVADGFVPLISGMEGFVAYYWFDEGDGVMCSASIFEERSHEERRQELVEKLEKACDFSGKAQTPSGGWG